MLIIEPGAGARDRLKAAFEAGQPSVVLIRPKTGDKLGAGEVKPLVDVAQDQGAAAILFEDADLAALVKADGVHLPAGLDVRLRVEAARAVLGAEASIGVDAGHSRHSAMEAGEAGAEYVAFGAGDGTEAGRCARDDLIAWWGEIFEVPCVALDLASGAEVAAANHNGADFAGLVVPSDASIEAVMTLVGDADMALMQNDDAADRA